MTEHGEREGGVWGANLVGVPAASVNVFVCTVSSALSLWNTRYSRDIYSETELYGDTSPEVVPVVIVKS
ncbi:hypothetical protein KIPB_006850 [Kipferlia bialata]|uniref:Uncharacterized protein n=1 Tax=Kipferlia bialata TaxID=797122 RepID=A0A9K3GII4_9EUKA|nr:hypothetical protein KIPB_006850 [Kipferlia bialata]|eukprot:g6850.t1